MYETGAGGSAPQHEGKLSQREILLVDASFSYFYICGNYLPCRGETCLLPTQRQSMRTGPSEVFGRAFDTKMCDPGQDRGTVKSGCDVRCLSGKL